MVKIKVRTGKLGNVNATVDMEVEGNTIDVFATMFEVEEAIIKLLKAVEKQTGLNVREGFLSNIAERME